MGGTLETRVTYCRICEAICGLRVEVDVGDGERIVGIQPDPDNPSSRGYVCPKGMRMGEIHHDPDRLDVPVERVDGRWERRSWERALEEIGTRLRGIIDAHGPRAVAWYVGNPSAFSYSHALFAQAFMQGVRSPNLYTAASVDCNNKFVVSELMLGSPAVHPVPDFDHLRFFLMLGTNPAVSQCSFVHAPRVVEQLRGIVRRGGRVVNVNPRRTETARQVGEHLFVRPDTDALLLASMLQVLIAEGLSAPVADSVPRLRGTSELREAVKPYTPERTAAATGVPPAQVRELARALAASGPGGGGVFFSTGVNQGTLGSHACWLTYALNILTGNFDRAGSMLVSPQGLALARALRLLGVARYGDERSRIGEFPSVAGALPAGVLAEEILTPGEGQVRALFVSAGNPLLSLPGSARLERALRSLDLLVGIDLYVNDTGTLAHFNLPATDFLEREDFPLPQLAVMPRPFAQLTPAAVRPVGERREEWEIICGLARAARIPMFGIPGASALLDGLRLPFGRTVQLHPRRLLSWTLRVAGISLAEVSRHPHGVLGELHRAGAIWRKGALTDDGRVDLAPPLLLERMDAMDAALRRAEAEPSGAFRLISRREKLTHNSWMHNIPAFSRGPHRKQRAHLNPEDARRLGVGDDDRVRVSNELGEVLLDVHLSEDMMPGCIAVPHGWGHRADAGTRVAAEAGGVNINRITPDGPEGCEPIAGMAHMNGVAVKVERVELRSEEEAPSV